MVGAAGRRMLGGIDSPDKLVNETDAGAEVVYEGRGEEEEGGITGKLYATCCSVTIPGRLTGGVAVGGVTVLTTPICWDG